ncbi:MAG: PQQ-binding-like beta-propeller repeat protein [Pirellulales bacterium]
MIGHSGGRWSWLIFQVVAGTVLGGWFSPGLVSRVQADDWPQWLGPRRDGVWRETGVLSHFPAGGPRVLWRTPIAGGYAGPAVAAGRVFVTDYVTSGERKNDPGSRSELQGEERISCLDARTGQLLWRHAYPCAYSISYPSGPRSTPTVQGGKVYVLGATGNLLCLEAESGKVVWSRELVQDFQAPIPIWGFTSQPLVDGDKLLLIVGGPGSVVVAFHKDTGRELWRALDAKEQGYCSPTIIEAGGQRQLIIWHPQAIHGLDPESGRVFWQVPLVPQYGMSIQLPLRHGDLLFAGGIGNQAVALRLDKDQPGVKEEWRGTNTTALYPTCGAPLIDEQGILYGACQQGHFRAVELATGKRLWETFKPTTGTRFASSGTCFIVRQGERYFLMSENGDLIIARLSAKGYDELDRAAVIKPTNEAFGRPVVWTHPAFANRTMVMRNDAEVVCVSLAAE